MTCKGRNCTASADNGYKHSDECRFEYARNLASGVESVAIGVTIPDEAEYATWRGKNIGLAILASHPSPDVEAMVEVAARELAAREAAENQQNPEEYWIDSRDSFIADARAALHAIGLPGMVANDARYRWLRDMLEKNDAEAYGIVEFAYRGGLTSAIDAALAQQANEK